MDKYQFADNMISQIMDIPIDNIMSNYISIRKKSGRHKKALCPFHNDKKIGSFVITPHKQMWYCFTCGIGGNAINFVSEFTGKDYIHSAFEIGLDFKIINQSDYEEYFNGRRYNNEKVKNIQKKYDEKNKKRIKELEGEKADSETLDKVYRIFLKHTYLKKEHESRLKSKRKLSKDKIEKYNFFTFPDRRALRGIISDIKEEFGNTEVLGTIPGFYYENEKEKFSFMRVKGIGIPSVNLDNQIEGFQIRKDYTSGKSGRYLWFGSTFAVGHEKLSKGTSSGAPLDVVIPNEIKSRTVFVTEGKFKAIALAEKTNAIVINVAGVTSWRGIPAIIKELSSHPRVKKAYKKNKKYEVKVVMIAYDADISMNVAVFKQAEKMSKELKKIVPYVQYLYWDSNVAKGIDDLFNINMGHLINRYRVEEFNNEYNKMLDMILDKEDEYEEVREVPSEVIKEYFKKVFNLRPLKRNEY